eukprot:1300759-Rhodomonas_salina.2
MTLRLKPPAGMYTGVPRKLPRVGVTGPSHGCRSQGKQALGWEIRTVQSISRCAKSAGSSSSSSSHGEIGNSASSLRGDSNRGVCVGSAP